MVSLKQIEKKNKKLLENLMQLYLHDISLYFPVDINSNTCKYVYDDLDKYFDSSDNNAYLFMDGDNVIGFTLINKEDNNMVVQEMFILNNYKNKKLGELSISKIFDKYKGNWVIRSLPCSPKSESFWNKTIGNYTNNKYSVEHIGKYNRAVFKFNNKE